MKVKMMRLMIIVERLKRIPADDDAHGRNDDDNTEEDFDNDNGLE